MRILALIILCLLCTKGFSQKDTLFENQELIIRKKSAYYKGNEIYNADRELENLIKKEKTDECGVSYRFYYNPLSLVGNYYSYESGEGGVLACGVPGSSLSVQTINLENNKKTSISDLFLEESILKALKNDSWIKRNMEENKIDFHLINSVKAFFDRINSLGDVRFNLNSFAILEYDKKYGKVSVRLVGTEYMGYNHSRHLQLGLLLEPKEPYKHLFQNNMYFTVGDFNSGLIK
ncbi:hypothetical protein J8L85_13535 [Maribacter sp. MMG018]|uniref:hypothetical protein n=1 Tax=Maribacter sp. MMG018 TaxID=2822688 RepID=UPI001B386F3C|nr:hypothetical protein [Maribacter sp. MMG018]MBQ4915471.1 hypothetical protein [Maribacter sp. MMG018]